MLQSKFTMILWAICAGYPLLGWQLPKQPQSDDNGATKLCVILEDFVPQVRATCRNCRILHISSLSAVSLARRLQMQSVFVLAILCS